MNRKTRLSLRGLWLISLGAMPIAVVATGCGGGGGSGSDGLPNQNLSPFAGVYRGSAKIVTGAGAGSTSLAVLTITTNGVPTLVLTDSHGLTTTLTGTVNSTTGVATLNGKTSALDSVTFNANLILKASSSGSGNFTASNGSKGTITLAKVAETMN